MARERQAELVKRAHELAQSGPADEAERINLEILELDPTNLGALRRLGKISKDLGQNDAAITYFRRTLELAPGDTIATNQLERLEGGPIHSIPRNVDLAAINMLMETISTKVEFSEPVECGPVTVTWPVSRVGDDERERRTGIEEYAGGWDITAMLGSRRYAVRHLLGYRIAYGRLRRRSLTYVHDNVEAEGVEADDYARTNGLLSVLRYSDGTHVRSKGEIPAGYGGFLQVWHHDEILAPGSPQSLAIKLREDDLLGWASHALLRAAGRRRLG